MIQQLFQEKDIPVHELEKIGLFGSGRMNLNEQDLQSLLSGKRTGLVRLKNIEADGLRIKTLDAKLSLRKNMHGSAELIYYPIYKMAMSPEYLTDQEAENLVNGEIANLEKKVETDGRQKDVLIEFDQETNEFVITDTERILAPDMVNSEPLTAEQKLSYKRGEEVELSDGTKFQFSNTDSKGIRSNKLALIASVIVDGGVSYLLYQGLHALFGQCQEKETADDFSIGYFQALEDMQGQPIQNQRMDNHVYMR